MFLSLACVAAMPERGANVSNEVVEKFQERNGLIFTDLGVVTTTGGGAAMLVDQLGIRGVVVEAASAET